MGLALARGGSTGRTGRVSPLPAWGGGGRLSLERKRANFYRFYTGPCAAVTLLVRRYKRSFDVFRQRRRSPRPHRTHGWAPGAGAALALVLLQQLPLRAATPCSLLADEEITARRRTRRACPQGRAFSWPFWPCRRASRPSWKARQWWRRTPPASWPGS